MLFYVVFSVDVKQGQDIKPFVPAGAKWFRFADDEGHVAFSAELNARHLKEFATKMKLFSVQAADNWTLTLAGKHSRALLAAYATPILMSEQSRLTCIKSLEDWVCKAGAKKHKRWRAVQG